MKGQAHLQFCMWLRLPHMEKKDWFNMIKFSGFSQNPSIQHFEAFEGF